MAVKLSTIFKMELSLFSAYYTHPEIPVYQSLGLEDFQAKGVIVHEPPIAKAHPEKDNWLTILNIM